MTTSATEKTGTWSFQICTCRGDTSHGYFHNGDGEIVGTQFASVESALNALNRAVSRGTIPESDQQAIEEMLRGSGLPESNRQAIKQEMDRESGSSQELPSIALRTGRENEGAPLKAWFDVGGVESPKMTTKYELRQALKMPEISLFLYFNGQDLADLMRQIDESELPEGEAPTPGAEFSFRRCTTCSRKEVHGYFYNGEERVPVGQGMFLNAESALGIVTSNTENGTLSPGNAERIKGEIESVFAQA